MDFINSAPIMAGLKDFQRRTVDYVFRRLYTDEDRVNRFLIADEVGLGKTLVAKGVIAKSIERLWEDVERIDIVYICANRDIARQNINRLNVTGKQEFQLARRLTMLPVNMKRLHGNKINFISFTPQTSFNLRSAEGIYEERAMIYHILKERWDLGDGVSPMNVLQCDAGTRNWRSFLSSFPKRYQIDEELKQNYLRDLEKTDLEERFYEVCERPAFARGDGRKSWEDRKARRRLIGELRTVLARSCISALEPDLIILDEFQRFRDLLDGEDEMADLARRVFEYPDVKVILLSATPYKMYTMYHESATDNHYDDFLRTVKFLLNSEDGISDFKQDLQRFRNALINWFPDDNTELMNAKAVIEDKLKHVMVRTERVAQSRDRSSMVANKEDQSYTLEPDDIVSFKILDKIASKLKAGDTVEYWKSAPYLLNIMDRSSYEIKRKFENMCKNPESDFIKDIQSVSSDLLQWDTVKNYLEISPKNYKLRNLIESKVNNGGWQLLWIPASLPYYKVIKGPYADPEILHFTKALVFSSWVVVPKVIAMLTSYEAERLMVTQYDPSADYGTEKRRAQLLRFALNQDRISTMSTFLLFYPCLTLATEFDPLQLSLDEDRQQKEVGGIVEEVQDRLHQILDPIVEQNRVTDAENDERWYWISLALLDNRDYWQQVKQWLSLKDSEFQWKTTYQTGETLSSEGAEIPRIFTQHLAQFLDFENTVNDLGYPPRDLFTVLSNLALAGPGVIALRSLLRHFPDADFSDDISWLLGAAGKIAMGFRTLFNLSESMTLLRIESDGENVYWKSVLDYCLNGNIQAVMDEYVHILNESLGLKDVEKERSSTQIATEIYDALAIRTAGPEFDEIKPVAEERVIKLDDHQIRCRYALRYGNARTDTEEGEIRATQIRSAFNSPFRPFILATTSIGQEGLDFHQYCHEIYHWNLPSNPVDFEQREGRIHRYKGHVIRKNLAKDYPISKLPEVKSSNVDPWELIFELAKANREEGQSDLVPYWIYEPEGGYKVYRHIPLVPLSRDSERLTYLTKSVAAYRMVLGQPRQEDLVTYLVGKLKDDPRCESIFGCQIDLSPPELR